MTPTRNFWSSLSFPANGIVPAFRLGVVLGLCQTPASMKWAAPRDDDYAAGLSFGVKPRPAKDATGELDERRGGGGGCAYLAGDLP